MNLVLKPELQQFIAEKLQAGQYADASDIVNQALEALMEQENFTPEHEGYLRREVQRGLEQLDRGETSDFNAETIIAEERRRLSNARDGK